MVGPGDRPRIRAVSDAIDEERTALARGRLLTAGGSWLEALRWADAQLAGADQEVDKLADDEGVTEITSARLYVPNGETIDVTERARRRLASRAREAATEPSDITGLIGRAERRLGQDLNLAPGLEARFDDRPRTTFDRDGNERWVDEPDADRLETTDQDGRCVGCGCTDERACEGGCSWVAPGLCSRCADEADEASNLIDQALRRDIGRAYRQAAGDTRTPNPECGCLEHDAHAACDPACFMYACTPPARPVQKIATWMPVTLEALADYAPEMLTDEQRAELERREAVRRAYARTWRARYRRARYEIAAAIGRIRHAIANAIDAHEHDGDYD